MRSDRTYNTVRKTRLGRAKIAVNMFPSRRTNTTRKNARPFCINELVNGIRADRGVERA